MNAVRWSASGTYLASGADDKLIMIWKKFAGGGSNFGGTVKNVENWRCAWTCRGHGGDVLDVAWSPQDRFLASCSIDNNVIVWDAESFHILATLKGHTGLVKGVAWDPVGKFLASQSDDRSIKIWKTFDWTNPNTITEPFEECAGTTHILRLCWSPDGQYLVSAHSMNGGGPTAQIIERDGWKCDKDFVGHRKAVTCVRFHNSILERKSQKTNKNQQYCCLAIGSRDRCLSVWMTALQRPLLVIRDLFEDSILDLSWSNDGYVLLACSGDGTIACLQFNEDQLGKPLSEEDKNSLYQRMYGKDATIDLSAQAEKELIIENAELLNVSQEKPRGPPSLIPSAAKESPQVSTPPTSQTTSIQTIKNSTSSPSKPILKQTETRRPDGKRRITPMFIPISDSTSQSRTEFGSSSSQQSVASSPQLNSASEAPKVQQQTISLSQMSTDSLKLDTRLAFREIPQKMQGEVSSISTVSPASAAPSTFVRPFMPVVKISSGKAQPLTGSQCVKMINEFRVQVTNDAYKTPFGQMSKVVCMNMQQAQSGDRKLWEVTVGSAISSFSICTKFVLIGAMDGTVRFLHIKDGQLLVPILNQASPIFSTAFSPNSTFGGVMTENAKLSVWNMNTLKIHVKSKCDDILNGSGYINIFYISEIGISFVGTSTGSSYSYSADLESWMLVNSNDALTRNGLHGSIANVKNMKTFPVATLQYISHTFQQKTKIPTEQLDDAWETQSKLSFIEHQIKLCENVNSPQELKHWYATFGYYLANHGSEKKVRQVLDDLLGPIYSLQNDEACKEKHKILGISKHDLLQEVLSHFRTSTKWQRLYCEYSDQLKSSQSMDTS